MPLHYSPCSGGPAYEDDAPVAALPLELSGSSLSTNFLFGWRTNSYTSLVLNTSALPMTSHSSAHNNDVFRTRNYVSLDPAHVEKNAFL